MNSRCKLMDTFSSRWQLLLKMHPNGKLRPRNCLRKGDDGRSRILVSAQEMIIRRRKDRFIAEIVPNVPPKMQLRPPVAAATGLPDVCQISTALLLRPPLFHIIKNCCWGRRRLRRRSSSSTIRQQLHAAAAPRGSSTTRQQHHVAAEPRGSSTTRQHSYV